MTTLSRDQILSAQDVQIERVFVPEWGGEVLVRGLRGFERDEIEASMIARVGKDWRLNIHNLRAKLVAMSVVDEHGNRIFSDSDVDALGKKSAAALQRVFEVAQRLSGLSAEDVEALGKASASVLSADSGSGSL